MLGVLTVAAPTRTCWRKHRPADVARDPDVLGAQRLFTAWLEGQMLYRHLPGIAVGVVADQELIWSTGFGFADTGKKVAMTPQTKFRMASHSKLFTATAIMQLREQGKLRLDDPVSKYLPWFEVTTGRVRRSADHDRRAADAQLGLAARSGLALDDLRVPDHRATAQADGRTAGAVLTGGAVEVFEPRVSRSPAW